MKNTIIKALLLIASACVLVSIGVIIGINIKLARRSPVLVDSDGHAWTLGVGEEATLIEDNFWRFIDASYVLVGTPPDCEFYKIVKEVPRHNYDVENFYIEDGDDVMYYHSDDGSRASMVVIDVSTYQTDIDWEAVKADGVDGVMIRVGYRGYGSEGKLVLDDMFVEHVEGATAAGLRVGVYFFSQAINYDEGVEEARFVLDAIKDYNITCPVVIDTEYIEAEGARTEGLSVEARTDGVVGFCDAVKQAGYRPMIYANRNWFVQCLDMTRLGGYELWLAHYVNQTDFPYRFTGWQYTNQGTVSGISGSVDINVWFEN